MLTFCCLRLRTDNRKSPQEWPLLTTDLKGDWRGEHIISDPSVHRIDESSILLSSLSKYTMYEAIHGFIKRN